MKSSELSVPIYLRPKAVNAFGQAESSLTYDKMKKRRDSYA
jgi:hypothetical protein